MAAGPNDIEAKFILKDEVSAVAKTIEKNVAASTKNVGDATNKTKSVFDKYNFSINAASLAMKVFHSWLQRTPEAQQALSGTLDYTIAKVNELGASLLEYFGADGETKRKLSLGGLVVEMDRLRATNEALNKSFSPDGPSADQFAAIMQTFRGVEGEADALRETYWRLTAQTITANEKQIELDDAAARISTTFGISGDAAKALATKIVTLRDTWKAAADRIRDKPLIDPEDFVKQSNDDAKKAADDAEELARIENFGDGWRAQTKELETEFLKWGNIAKRTAKEMHSTFSNDLFAALKGEQISFLDFSTHILDNFLKQITDAVSAQALGLVGGLLGGGSSSFVGSSSGILGQTLTGGFNAGASSNGDIPRYADGGTVYRPTLAIVGEGGEPEDVVPHSRRAAYARAHGGGGETHIHNYYLSGIDGPSIARVFSSPEARAQMEAHSVRGMNRRSVRSAIRDA